MILLILVFLLEYSMHEGVGTSTFIMAFTAASGAIGHAFTGNLPLEAAVLSGLGTVIGAGLLHGLQTRLRKGFELHSGSHFGIWVWPCCLVCILLLRSFCQHFSCVVQVDGSGLYLFCSVLFPQISR